MLKIKESFINLTECLPTPSPNHTFSACPALFYRSSDLSAHIEATGHHRMTFSSLCSCAICSLRSCSLGS